MSALFGVGLFIGLVFGLVLGVVFGTMYYGIYDPTSTCLVKQTAQLPNSTNTTRDWYTTNTTATTAISTANADPPLHTCSVYFHLHIHKAGGTALAASMFGSSLMESCREDAALLQKCKTARCGGLDAFYSRVTNGWRCGVHPDLNAIRTCKEFRKHKDVPIRIISLVRNPVDRLLSEYRHCNATNRLKACWQYGFPNPPSVVEFATMNNTQLFRNRQTKMLSGCPHKSDWADERVMTKCFEQAKENARDKLFFIGVFEEFDISLQALSRKMGETLTPPKENTHSDERHNGGEKRSSSELTM